MIAFTAIAWLTFTIGFVAGRWSYRRELAHALKRLAPRTPDAVLDHDAIRQLVTQYRFPSATDPSTHTPP